MCSYEAQNLLKYHRCDTSHVSPNSVYIKHKGREAEKKTLLSNYYIYRPVFHHWNWMSQGIWNRTCWIFFPLRSPVQTYSRPLMTRLPLQSPAHVLNWSTWEKKTDFPPQTSGDLKPWLPFRSGHSAGWAAKTSSCLQHLYDQWILQCPRHQSLPRW